MGPLRCTNLAVWSHCPTFGTKNPGCLAIGSLERFEHRTEGSFRNSLAACVENAIRNEVRKHDAIKRGAGRVQCVADFATTRLAESLFPDGAPGVSQAARDREDEERIEAALLQLAPRYREAIALRVHGEMSHREIAEAMGLPSENTANALFVRARRKLLRILSESEGV
jgi:RNA polymerase sigma factor (sigma-70 family)